MSAEKTQERGQANDMATKERGRGGCARGQTEKKKARNGEMKWRVVAPKVEATIDRTDPCILERRTTTDW